MARVLEEWEQDLVRVVGDQLMRDIVADNRKGSMRANPATAKVTVEGAATVNNEQPSTKGWYEPAQIKDWKAPGIAIVDRLCDMQDQVDRAARARELAQVAAALQKDKQE
jgi:hypothetical protein